MAELATNFMIAMFTGILMVFAVLVLLFARVLQPITILARCCCRLAVRCGAA